MKINWQVRLKNKSWWVGVISAVVAAVFAVLKICRIDVSVTAEEIMDVAMLMLMIPVAIGIINDPTTKGLSDSAQAMNYTEPKSDDELGSGPMNFDNFVNTYLGRAADYDNVCGVQCVDLIKLYLDKVFSIKAGAWGNAKYYWLDFDKHSALKSAFKKISNTAAFVPQKGDIIVWQGDINGGCGHVAIATGEGNTKEFYSYDQNWGGKAMRRVKHNYKCVYGVLRPLDQSKVADAKKEDDFEVRTWKNGSTKETVYADTAKTMKIGELAPHESCNCFGKIGGMYIVAYKVNGKSSQKCGFVSYHG